MTRYDCPFCRAPFHINAEEANRRVRERAETHKDPEAMLLLGYYYERGSYGFPQDRSRAAGYYFSASELGSAEGHFELGKMYHDGTGVELDRKKSVRHWQIAAIMGHDMARYYLGVMDYNNDNMERAMRHFMIAAKVGHNESLKGVKQGYMAGIVAKHDFEQVLRAHQASKYEMKSKKRDAAAKRLAALRGSKFC